MRVRGQKKESLCYCIDECVASVKAAAPGRNQKHRDGDLRDSDWIAAAGCMTTVDLLRTLLVPIIVFFGALSLARPFLGAHVYPFACRLIRRYSRGTGVDGLGC